ncbi:Uu.00g132080.m01.CDS01 [Anthostomella pinea]|uniref:Uu.00g132080.m01.CDS01 n=1 Tax=Anthostomella pinea TaxID=933095 RepID=A0AAI8VK47_9PEZI|nr:Uu.00g132080.m01.CDS01 [Anthostomella pinea]
MAPKRKPAVAADAAAPSTTKKTATKTAKPATKAAPKKAAAPKTAPKKAPKKAAAPKNPVAADKEAPKKAPAKKSAPAKTVTTKAGPKATRGLKRKAPDDEDDDSSPSSSSDEDAASSSGGPPQSKRPRASADESKMPRASADGLAESGTARRPRTAGRAVQKPAPPKAPAKPFRKRRFVQKVQNERPTKVLDVFVFGEGSAGELGLGSTPYEGKKPKDVKRPRFNHNLDADKGVEIVQIACGGMHVAALTSIGNVLTWGVNDDKALGRDTTWESVQHDIDDSDSDSGGDDESGLNPLESTPSDVSFVGVDPPDDDNALEEAVRYLLDVGMGIVQVAATDSATFALTPGGQVYGWGTFRGADGIIGFSKGIKSQPTPMLIEGLQWITKIVCGSNHVVALDVDGRVFTWGSGGQYQLGRKPLSRHSKDKTELKPQACGKFFKNHYAIDIAAGSYHSFYIDNKRRVWSWGLNNYSQTGLYDDTGKDDAMVLEPKIVTSLEKYKVKMIAGGEHHSVACTDDGTLLTWGRIDGHQVGHPLTAYNEDNAIFDDSNKPRILIEPTPIKGIYTTFVAAGTDTSFAIDNNGHVHSWGFSANYQTGQGTTDDVEVPEVIDNTAIRDRVISFAGAGGQYSLVASERPGQVDLEEGGGDDSSVGSVDGENGI